MSADNDLHAIIADQAETIDQLRAERDRLQDHLTSAQTRLHGYMDHTAEGDADGSYGYWQFVYDRIRAAWDAWALAELGTSTPSPLDLAGRSELAALWEAVR